MIQEEKQLLLKDLSARLPYGVIAYASEINKTGIITDVNITYNMVNLTVNSGSGKYELVPLLDIKPYFRPMSSMTEEEREEYFGNRMTSWAQNEFGETYSEAVMQYRIDFLLEHHFDYRDLIEKGLALEAPEDMYE